MRIMSIRPAPPGGQTIAHVDIEPSPGTRIYGIRVSRADDGSYRAFGQNSDRGRTCAFSPQVVTQIAEAVISELSFTSHRSNDNHPRKS